MSPSKSPLLLSLAVAATTLSALPAQDWWIEAGLTEAGLEAAATARNTAGFAPISLSVHETPTGVSYAVIWERDASNTTWAITKNDTESEFTTENATRASRGFRPVSVDTSGDAPSRAFAAIWRRDLASFGAVTARTDITPTQLSAVVTGQARLGRQPFWVGGSGFAANARLCALFGDSAANASTTGGLDGPGLTSWLETARTNGDAVLATASYRVPGGRRYVGLTSSAALPVDGTAGLSPEELDAFQRWMLARNFTPVSIDGWESATGTRYTVSWRETDAPYRFVGTGSTEPELAALDTAMQTYMANGDVAHALLAVTKDGRLVHMRGYNRTRTGSRVAQPDSEARIGSLSKPLTAIGILTLVDKGLLNLDDTVASILDLSAYVDPLAQTMTVRQLLTHTSGIGDSRLIDNEETIANDLGRSLPTNPQMWVDWYANQAFATTAYPTWEYSNFGYCLLGRIIEEVSGLRYETYMNRAVFGPACAARMRIGSSKLAEQTRREIPYVDPGSDYLTSVLGDGATVPYTYGGYNMSSGDSVGGVVSSAEAYARILVALEDTANSPLLSQSLIGQMWAADPNTSFTGEDYALGWYVNDLGVRFHSGVIAGTYAWMGMRPDGVNFVAILGTTNPDVDSLANTIGLALNGITSWPSVDRFTDTGCLRTYGEGCGGPAGTPAFDLAPGSVPVVGENVGLVIDHLPPLATSATLIVGISRLDFDLGLGGLTGCTLYPAPLVDLPIPAANGEAPFGLLLPENSSLVGANLQMQAFALDVNLPRGLVFSDAAELHIGD